MEPVLGVSSTRQRAVPICQGMPSLLSWRWGAWVLFALKSQGSLCGGQATFLGPFPQVYLGRVNKVCLLDLVGVSGCSFWVSLSSVQFSRSVVSDSL